jgi:hypothetical protein
LCSVFAVVSRLLSTSSDRRFRRDPRDFSRGGPLQPELLTTLLLYMVADGNRRGYQHLLEGFWDEARSYGLELPTEEAVSAASFCAARHKITPDLLQYMLHEIAATSFETVFGSQRWCRAGVLYALSRNRLAMIAQVADNGPWMRCVERLGGNAERLPTRGLDFLENGNSDYAPFARQLRTEVFHLNGLERVKWPHVNLELQPEPHVFDEQSSRTRHLLQGPVVGVSVDVLGFPPGLFVHVAPKIELQLYKCVQVEEASFRVLETHLDAARRWEHELDWDCSGLQFSLGGLGEQDSLTLGRAVTWSRCTLTVCP